MLFSASPASTNGSPHENGRTYVATAPPDLIARLKDWLCPKNRRLGELLVRQRLVESLVDFPWLQQAEAGCPSIGQQQHARTS